MDGINIQMLDCERIILEECADKRFTQKSVVASYAWAITGQEKIDWKKVNAAIVARWSQSGLIRIKNAAWKLIKEKEAP